MIISTNASLAGQKKSKVLYEENLDMWLNGKDFTPKGLQNAVIKYQNGVSLTTNSFNNSNYSTYSFSGNTSYMHISSFPINFNNYSISLWFYNGNQWGWRRIFDIGQADGAGTTMLCGFNTTNSLSFHSYVNGTNTTQITTTITPNAWYYLTLTFNNGIYSLYLNGVKINSNSGGTAPPSVTTPTNIFIGRSNWSVDPYILGGQTDIRFYNKVLSDIDIQNIFNIGPCQ